MSQAKKSAPSPAPETPGKLPPPWLLPAVSFCAGAAIMIVEISGNRLIAPIFGNTIYTWTSLIGVVLMAMSLGGYLGGTLADRNPRATHLALMLGLAGISSILIPGIARLAEGMVDPTQLIVGPLIMCSLLFLIPGVLLGAVSPYAVKLLSVWRSDHAVGKSAGLISMAGALGSFAGTFATGFWLLATFDLRLILGATGGFLCLLALAMAATEKLKPKHAVTLLVLALLAGAISHRSALSTEKSTLYAHNNFYHLIRVVEQEGAPGQGPIRSLLLDSTTEGAVDLSDGSLPLVYQNYWRILTADPSFHPERALFIGAGAFGMPMAASTQWPEAAVEVVEIDPELITVGRKFFGLNDHPGVLPHAGDGRSYLRTQPAAHYDFLFGDAYNGVSYVPPHLVTTEFFALVASRLKADGVYMMNVISPVRDPKGSLGAGVLAGLSPHLPHIAVFAVSTPDLRARQNLVILASKSPLDRFLSPSHPDRITGHMLLTRLSRPVLDEMLAGTTAYTDMHNPIDSVIARHLLDDKHPEKPVF